MNVSKEILKTQEPNAIRLANGRTLSFHTPLVMGIINITPDSFYDGGRYLNINEAVDHAEKLLDEGADIIDLGACSTRPNAEDIGEATEMKRLMPVLEKLINRRPDAVISIDTYRSKVALEAGSIGANIINDISGGTMDDKMFESAALSKMPYILMHIQGTPQTMQKFPSYINVAAEVEHFFATKLDKLNKLGVEQIIIDPGFGFGKTSDHNYMLLKNLGRFTKFRLPILAGISRKSMINKPLGIKPENALTGTTVLNTIAILQGANILRVHDVAEAKQVVKLVQRFMNLKNSFEIPA